MPASCPLCHLEHLAATDAEGAIWSAICLGRLPAVQIRQACCEKHAQGARPAVARGQASLRGMFGVGGTVLS